MADKVIKLLIVEDDDVDRETIKKALRHMDAEFIEASDGMTCLGKMDEHKDLGMILLDYKLPDIDGLKLIRLIKEKDPEIPVIIITGFGNEDLVKVTTDMGVLDYIPKDKLTPEFLARTIINDLLIHRTQLEKKIAEAAFNQKVKEEIETLTRLMEMARARIIQIEQTEISKTPEVI